MFTVRASVCQDLPRTDWLHINKPTQQRTRSLSSEHVYANGTVYAEFTDRKLMFANSSLVANVSIGKLRL